VPPDAKLREHVGINWIDDKVTATDGPIQASFTDSPANPLGKAWVKAFETLGGGITADPFSGHSTGAFSCRASVDRATETRSYSASAYYAPAAQCPNLDVVTDANAKKIVLEGSSGDSPWAARAGVFTDENGEHRVKAKREVILAAGAFQAPKLLGLSGIGDKSLLQKLGITSKVDNPAVGENLQDHLMTGISFEVADGIMTGDPLVRQEPGVLELFMKMYQEHQAGPLASGALMSSAFTPILVDAVEKLDAGAMESLEQAIKDSQHSDDHVTSANQRSAAEYLTTLLQAKTETTGALVALPVQINFHNGPRQIGMTTNPVEGNYLSIGAALVHPLSRGSSHIASADPAAPPVIDPRYLSHLFDAEVYARHLMAVEASRGVGATLTAAEARGQARAARAERGQDQHRSSAQRSISAPRR
jgi:choline dehydrogenase-like flavoprotein